MNYFKLMLYYMIKQSNFLNFFRDEEFINISSDENIEESSSSSSCSTITIDDDQVLFVKLPTTHRCIPAN